ncbi:MAG: class I SAM-dependent DNA methyltransferase, partial [Sandaracinaceae bacterium]|nr:class I SAM-dependent DNA methyltransferase [Sandaracinaceae bacterium]
DKLDEQAEAEEELLRRLVALNAERAAEEARGHVRWLRPDFQAPTQETGGVQGTLAGTDEEDGEVTSPASTKVAKITWPKAMRDQIAAVRGALSHGGNSPEALAGQFKRRPEAAVRAVLEALEELGMVRKEETVYRLTA